jgi:protein SCO1/2
LVWGACALLAVLVAVALVIRGRGSAGTSAAPPAAARHPDERLPVLADIPAFSFTNVDGRTIDPSALRGHVWIADLIFTRCVTTCPITTAKMNVLRRSIPSDEIRFVSFSIDPDYDTPAVLGAYARRWSADPRWLLLSGPTRLVTEFVTAMKMPFQRTAMPDEPILHSTLFFLIDQQGRLRGEYNSLEDASVRRLAADATWLEGASAAARDAGLQAVKEPQVHGASRGQTLFQSLGCAACHGNPKLGPPLGGLAGRKVRLEDGATTLADASYLRESILAPGEKVVSGYNRLMPGYADFLASADVDDLVAYLQTMPPPAAHP